MPTSLIPVTAGSGTNLATHTITEDSSTKHLYRTVISDSAGAEAGIAAKPIQVSLANHATNATAVKVDGSSVTQPVSTISTGKTLKVVTGTVSATSSVISAVASKRLKVVAYALLTSSSTAVVATFKTGAGGTALWTIPMQAISGTVFGANLATQCPSFLFATNAGELLELSLSAAVSVTYSITYWDDDNT